MNPRWRRAGAVDAAQALLRTPGADRALARAPGFTGATGLARTIGSPPLRARLSGR